VGWREYRASRSRGLVGGAWSEGLVRRAGRAHSVRPESCDSPSSPEPAASWFGGDYCLLGRRACGVPGQRAGSGKAAAGFRIPRPSAGGEDLRFEMGRVRREGREPQISRMGTDGQGGWGSEKGLFGGVWGGACGVARVQSLAIPGLGRRRATPYGVGAIFDVIPVVSLRATTGY
jgi:hypothetical protein